MPKILFVEGIIDEVSEDVHHWHDNYCVGQSEKDDSVQNSLGLNENGYSGLFEDSAMAGANKFYKGVYDDIK